MLARDKLKVVKSAPQPLCVYTIVHPSVRETWSVAESENLRGVEGPMQAEYDVYVFNLFLYFLFVFIYC